MPVTDVVEKLRTVRKGDDILVNCAGRALWFNVMEVAYGRAILSDGRSVSLHQESKEVLDVRAR
jgi:hypothetical protein